MHARLLALLTLLLALVVTARAEAYVPPPMTAHVTDTAGKLTETQRLAVDKKLEDYRLRTSNEIVVFIPKSLEGERIEDVGVDTGRAWKIGAKGKDNGVVLVVAPAERRAWIATNRGVEGALTDLQSNDIVRQKMRPLLTPGHEDYYAAIQAATDAIMADLDADSMGASGVGPTGPKATPPPPHPASAGDVLFALVFFGLMLGVPILLVILFIRAVFRGAFSSHGRSASSGWASGGSWSSDSSWSSGGLSWSSSSNDSFGGGGGDSGFTGGGSDNFGGGGGGDSF